MADAAGIYKIPAENLRRFEEMIARLSKKSVKLLGPDYEIKPVVMGYETEGEGGFVSKIYDVLLSAKEPKCEGWEFIAKLDHANEVGNIVRVVPGKEMPEHYRTADHTNCDHCRTRRYRRDTYVVRNTESGSYMQIGSACLRDFLGHDVDRMAKLAELLGFAHEAARGATGPVDHADLRSIHLETYLGFAASSIRRMGWTSRADARRFDKTATADLAMADMGQAGGVLRVTPSDYGLVTDKDRELAKEALAWVDSLTDADLARSDYLYNIHVIAASGVIEARSIGFAASIVGSYMRDQARKNPTPRNVTIDNVAGIVALMEKGKSHLKRPKIIVRVNDQDLRLTIAGDRSRYPGSVNVTSADGDYDGREWYGRIDRDSGKFFPSNRVRPQTQTAILSALQAFAADPAGIAAKYGKLTGNCCFCGRPLTDARSTEVGYGPICAKHYDLPWGTATAETAVAAADAEFAGK